jgi:hypothetical protein
MSQVFFGSFVVGKKCVEKSSLPSESSVSITPVDFLDMRESLPYQVITLMGLRNFSSNQEAIESGLGEGAVYRNGDQLCIVHHWG